MFMFMTTCSSFKDSFDGFLFSLTHFSSFTLWLFRGSHRGGGACGPARDRDLGLSPQCLSVFFRHSPWADRQSPTGALPSVFFQHSLWSDRQSPTGALPSVSSVGARHFPGVHCLWQCFSCHWTRTLPRSVLVLGFLPFGFCVLL